VLVITRKRGEAIVIGDGIEIRVLRVGRDGVRLGVTAPADVAVNRQEVYEAVRAANASAAQGVPVSIHSIVERFRRAARSQ